MPLPPGTSSDYEDARPTSYLLPGSDEDGDVDWADGAAVVDGGQEEEEEGDCGSRQAEDDKGSEDSLRGSESRLLWLSRVEPSDVGEGESGSCVKCSTTPVYDGA